MSAEHRKSIRRSTREKHQEGQARKRRDAGKEKGDKQRWFKKRKRRSKGEQMVSQHDNRIERLLEEGAWKAARKLLEKERGQDPENHWLITQIGVTYYEERQYAKALRLFRQSFKIVPDCPLTLWNLAGALDALGKTASASRIFTWLLESKSSPEDDPCWENQAWTDSLKLDCVYSLGTCFQRLGKERSAEQCFRQYLNLLSIGVEGTYPAEDVLRQIRTLNPAKKNGRMHRELQAAVAATLKATVVKAAGRRQNKPRPLNVEALLAK